MDAKVREWELVVSDLAADGPDLVELGKALETDATLMGWVKETGAAVEVYARLVDTDTGAILSEKDVFHERKSLRSMEELLFGLALKLEAALPLLHGTVQSAAEGRIDVAMTDAALLPPGSRLLVYSTDGGAEALLGEARLVATGAEGGVEATLLSGKAAPGAMVVTK